MTAVAGTGFDTLVAPHLGALYRAAYRLTGNAPDAEDLVQEVCLRACSKVDELHGVESVRAWLLRVQYRVFVDGARRRRRSPLRPLSAEIEASERMFSAEPGPEDQADAWDSNGRLSRAWAALEARQQALLALHAEGYSLDELRHITGLSKNVLTARLHRARSRLAKLLERDAGASLLGSTGELI